MNKKLAALTMAALMATATGAMADRALVAKDGTVYSETAFDSGSRLVNASETITLTERCTARIAGRGTGHWNWTPQGTRVTVGSHTVRFSDVPLISMVRCAG